jgi:hypothetical protein
MFPNLAGWFLPIAILAAAPPGAGATPPEIAALSVEQRDGEFFVSFRLEAGWDPELLGSVASGLETGFDYEVEVVRPRRMWPDEKVSRHRLEARAKYDRLTGQYSLVLKLDGEVLRSSATDREEEMKRWLTRVEGLPLGPATRFARPEEHEVRVKSDFPVRFVLLFIPWDRDTAWARAPLGPPQMGAREPAR